MDCHRHWLQQRRLRIWQSLCDGGQCDLRTSFWIIFLGILRWHVAHQVWLAFSVSKIQSEVYGVCLCAYSIHQLSRKQVSPKQYLICNLLHSDALIHDDLTMDSIVFALSWSSNSLALSLFILALEVCCLFPYKSVTVHWTVCSSNMQDKMFPGLDMFWFVLLSLCLPCRMSMATRVITEFYLLMHLILSRPCKAVSYKQPICVVFTQYRCTVITDILIHCSYVYKE